LQAAIDGTLKKQARYISGNPGKIAVMPLVLATGDGEVARLFCRHGNHDYGSRSVINVCVVDAGADVGGSVAQPRGADVAEVTCAIATGWERSVARTSVVFDGCKAS